MNKVKFSVITLLTLLFIVSCGNKKGTGESGKIVMKPSEVEVSGDLEGCFIVVEREYKASGDWANGIITVEIERTDNDLPFELGDRELCSFSTQLFKPNVQVGFGIEFLDEDGNIVDKVSADGSGFSGSFSPDEAVSLCKLKSNKKGTIRFSVDDSAKEAVSFRITSAYKENEGSESSDISDDNDSSDGIDLDTDNDHEAFSSGSEDWDDLLKSYEEYVDKYISYVKKASKGDMTALSEYPALMRKAQEFSDKMKNAESSMSASQWARYNKITMKMLEAAQNMHE